jgi:hypothetical protein
MSPAPIPNDPRRGWWSRLVILACALWLLVGLADLGPASAMARAAPVADGAFGVNFDGSPPNLSAASAAGVGVARVEVIDGTNADALVGLTAAAGLRLHPMLGIPVSNGPAADAAQMAAYVSSFADAYGPGGTFWALHPQLPYLPVRSFEIGNEPNISPGEPADSVHLHYSDPASYALVYESARSALHAVDPSGQAVVGGVLDSGATPLSTAEQYLQAIGPMDAVGFHPYLYDLAAMERDTQALRTWLDAHGHQSVPLDIDEFGSGNGFSTDISSWGPQVAQFTAWAVCDPALHVEDVQPFWWGAVPGADTDFWYSLFSSELTPTPLGSAYLAEVATLTRSGCPIPPVPKPSANPTPPPAHLIEPPAKLKARGPRTHRVTVTLTLAARVLFSGDSSRLSGAGQRRLSRQTPALMRSATVGVDVYATTLTLGWARGEAIDRFLITRAPRGLELTFASHVAKPNHERVLISYTRLVAGKPAVH